MAEHAHDPQRFTQGLALRNGLWVESSGLYNKSFVVVERDGEDRPSARFDLPANEFAEGAAFVDDRIWLLTWRRGIARQFNLKLEVKQTVRYEGEGWGLTYDGERLIMSDGSHRLQFRHAQDFSLIGTLPVHDAFRPVTRLNELEFAHGLVWANVFGDTRIAAIDPQDGRIRGWLELRELYEAFDKPDDWDADNNVLNGVSVDQATGHLHVTGKRWPVRYEIAVALPQ